MKSILMNICLLFLLLGPSPAFSQTIYDLNKYTPEQWLSLSTDEHMRALNTANTLSMNKNFYGSFNPYLDKYKRWGYDYYEMNDRYENYSFRNFENYNVLETRRNLWTYTDFGDRLENMEKKMELWTDRIGDDGISITYPTTGYLYYRAVWTDLEALTVVSESTKDWAVSAVAGNKLRAAFSPLTLSKPNFDGIIINYQSSNYDIKVVNSSFLWTVMPPRIRGVQLRRKFGAMEIGANITDSYRGNNLRQKGGSLKGTIEDFFISNNGTNPTYFKNVPPSVCFVRVLDDSPWDESGPIIYKIRLRINGQLRDDITPKIIMDDLRNETITAINPDDYPHQISYLENTNYANFYSSEAENNYPKFADYLLFLDWIKGNNSAGVANHLDLNRAKKYYQICNLTNEPIKISGTQYAVFMFDLSIIKENVQRVEAELTVANDYRIQISNIQNTVSSSGTETNYINDYTREIWVTKAVAEGNVKDFSNLRTISIDYGKEVANIIYGFDIKYDYNNLKIRGEIVKNTHFYMIPEGVPTYYPSKAPTLTGDITPQRGHRSSITDKAWYFTVEKEWENFFFGFEIFDMGKFYDPKFRKGADREDKNREHDANLIADNDDYDQYPDMFDQDGVFPGQDLDNDDISDTDKNLNGIPDYNETFLMYNSEPDEFAFGDDFNNNAIPDYREDDNKVDTPYDLDRKGHHFFVNYLPQKNIGISLGSMKTDGVAVANRTYKDYLKLSFNGTFINIGNMRAEYRYERVKDDIPDYYNKYDYKIMYSMWGAYDIVPKPEFDHLDYRNSRVNKFYLDTRMKPFAPLTVETFARYEANNKIPGWMYDGTFQTGGDIATSAVMGKISYTEKWKDFIFSAGYKSLFYKKDRSDQYYPDDYYTMSIPMVYLKYVVSPKSSVILGCQGFGNMEYRYRDFADSRNDFRRKDIVLEFQNMTDYFGFLCHGEWGFRLTDFRYDDKFRSIENIKTSSFFVKLVMGNEYNQ